MKLINNSIIGKKLLIRILLLSSVVTLVLTFFQLYRDFNVDVNLIDERFKLIEESNLKSIINNEWTFNESVLQVQLDGLLRFQDIKYVAIISPGGEVRISAGEKINSKHIFKEFSMDYDLNGELIHLGELHVIASLEGVYRRLKEKAIIILLSQTVKTFIVSAFILLVVNLLVTRPILQLSAFAKTIRHDNNKKMTIPVRKVSKPDEITDLYQSIGRMQTNLLGAYEESKNSAEWFKNIFDYSNDSIIIFNIETLCIIDVNNSGCLLLGYKRDELLQMNAGQIFPDENSHLINFLKMIESNKTGITSELYCKSNSGEIIPSEISASLLYLNGTRVLLAMVRDHREHAIIKAQEIQLQRNQKMDSLGKLVGGIAHDYNNMLAIILGYVDLLEINGKESDKFYIHLGQIKHAAQRSSNLTKKLLSFSKIKKAEAKEFNLNILLRDQNHMLEKILTAGIELKMILDEGLWTVNIDSGDLEDAIINLVINSMHAMDSRGQLIIRTSNEHITDIIQSKLGLEQGDYVCLSITDTGCGMSEDLIEKIFDPFFSTKGDKGSGLGLSQVYGFIMRSEGSLDVVSKIGSGTVISMYFPRNTRVTEKT